jgi:hypothetical protein
MWENTISDYKYNISENDSDYLPAKFEKFLIFYTYLPSPPPAPSPAALLGCAVRNLIQTDGRPDCKQGATHQNPYT